METQNLTANYQTSTGYRFISEGETAFKIHLHLPDDSVFHRSVGFIKLGKKKALRKALKIRNEQGKKAWRKFWPRVLNEHDLIICLPHSLEPNISSCGGYYVAMWSDNNRVRKYRKRSIKKHGKLSAYTQCKKILLEAHRDQIELLLFMGRLNTIDLK